MYDIDGTVAAVALSILFCHYQNRLVIATARLIDTSMTSLMLLQSRIGPEL
jgi:hypothetical protein